MLKVLVFLALLLTVESLAKQKHQRALNSPSPDYTRPTPSYSNCRSWISFSFDDSITLTSQQFRTQMSFIRDVVGTMNYPKRLRAEGAYTGEFTWNSYLSLAQMELAIGAAQQTSIPYSLSQMFAGLATSVELLNYPDDPIAVLIFISDTSDSALRGAERFFGLLNNVKITFVLLGENADPWKLSQFSSNFLYWSDLSQPQPDNWDYYASSALGCGSIASTVTYPYPASTPTPTTRWGYPSTTSWYFPGSTYAPYYPCDSWISFGVDTSPSLFFNNFNNQINFIASIIGKINHPERLQVIRNNGNSVVDWNSYGQSIPQIQLDVVQLEQTDGRQYSLRDQFAKLAAQLQKLYNYGSVGAIIFISDTSDDALNGADIFAGYLKDIRLTFVLMGSNADQSRLTKYSSNFIQWTDMSQTQPDNWDSLSYAAYGCDSWGKK